ncbi:MAG: transcriptional repressor [Actinomycetota bacterium]|nr:transcriptional repressor [Actinomycetota bacterium]
MSDSPEITVAAPAPGWAGFAAERIAEAGLRRSSPRQQVIDLLDAQDCAITALDMDARLPRIGRATVYRAIEQLEQLGLIQKVDLGGTALGYEKVDPSGHHHHHIVCDDCGLVQPFEDEDLEKAIHEVHRSGFKIQAHEVTLRGRCQDCQS